MRRLPFVLALTSLLASCVPNTPTAPPDARLPPAYRGVDGGPAPSLADMPWQRFYEDRVLVDLIAGALIKNENVQLAYAAILVARENLNITRANQFPAVSASVQTANQNTVGGRAGSVPSEAFVPEAAVAASYEIDLFGKLKSATAAARAQLLASGAAYDTVRWALVSQVASSYFQLRELDEVLDTSLKAERVREENLRLVKLRVRFGESSLQDQLQAQQSLDQVSENVPLVRQSIAQTENALSVLAGDYPRDVARGAPLEKQLDMPALPATGIPSELLVRRPDIRQAEDTLVAADAQIDVARKLLLPSFTFGTSAAVEGQLSSGTFPNLPKQLASLGGSGVFYGPLGVFSLLPQLTQAIFTGGALQARVRLTQAQQQQAVVSYLQTVQNAVRDVSNAVAAYQGQRAYRAQVELDERTSAQSTQLATLRYNEGQTSYLEVLNAQTLEYQADIATEQARLNERLALVQLYLTLGGGLSGSSTVSQTHG